MFVFGDRKGANYPLLAQFYVTAKELTYDKHE